MTPLLRRPAQLARQRVKTDSSATTTTTTTNDSADQTFGYMDDMRVEGYESLTPPDLLARVLPLSTAHKATIGKARHDLAQVFAGKDDRVVVVVGPCSIHDTDAALEYGRRLKTLATQLDDTLIVIMRAYFEKPRTTVGWKGLINDPFLDGSFRINDGLYVARKLLCDLTGPEIAVPVGSELLDTISPQFIGDLISWGAIGARTTESQLHRELASGVSFPIGFKNGTNGDLDIAIDAIRSAEQPHRFLGVTHDGLAAITKTCGNESCHVILRGGKSGPNYDCASIQATKLALDKRGLPARIMVDCSHGNSLKDHRNQRKVMQSLCEQISEGEAGIFGVMIESNLLAGNQKIPQDLDTLVYGQSVTDACVDWDETVQLLHALSHAVQQRRQKLSSPGN